MPTALNTSLVEVSRLNGPLAVRSHDRVAIEDPLEIQIGQERKGLRTIRSASVTMRTPGHDDELAIGFLFGEGILNQRSDVAKIEFPALEGEKSANCVRIELRAWTDSGLEAAGSELLHDVELRSLWKGFTRGGAKDGPRTLAKRRRRISNRSHDDSPNARATPGVARDLRADRGSPCSGPL